MQLKNTKKIQNLTTKPLIFLITLYQKYIFKNPSCKYYPCCSQYFKLSLQKYGLIKGVSKGVWRLLKCNPWSKGGIDKI